jgi:hypothetical protein
MQGLILILDSWLLQLALSANVLMSVMFLEECFVV